MAAITMNSRDAVSGSLAQCFVTIGQNRYNFMQIISFESSIVKTKTEVPILGRTGKGHKSTGWKGTFKGVAHYNQSVMRKLLLEFKNTGDDTYFDIQVTNEDPTSSIGLQTVILKDCNLNGGVLAKFDADAEYLSENISGTFDDFEIPQSFDLVTGML